jgi:DNA-directed RNA polymerase specialized sigma24 family protein
MTSEEHGELNAQPAERARNGDDAALVKFAERWWPPIYRFLWNMSGSTSYAAEATEQTLLAAIRSGEAPGSSEASLKVFLYREALHFALLRHGSVPPGRTPADAAATLREALARMNPLDRARVIFFEVEQLSLEQIAAAMSTPPDETRSRVYHSLLALTECVTHTLHSIALRATG